MLFNKIYLLGIYRPAIKYISILKSIDKEIKSLIKTFLTKEQKKKNLLKYLFYKKFKFWK